MSIFQPVAMRLAATTHARSSMEHPSDNTTPLTVLSDDEVITLLEQLTVEEVLDMQQSLRTALHEYSTAKQDNPACQKNQQERMVGLA
jgi:hypothetical protein